MQELDPRVIQVQIEVNGRIKTYTQELAITASGTKYANPLQNEAQVTLINLDKATQDYILTETSPFNRNRTPKRISIYAGRKSYGVTLIYSGNIVSSIVSQPPDIGVTLKCLTGNFIKGTVLARGQPGLTSLSQIAKQVAQDTNTILNFQAQDKNIANYNYSGNALGQVDALSNSGNVNAYIDDNILVVKNAGVPISGVTRTLNAKNGLIGIPEFTEQGIKVKYLLDNISKLGGGLQISSEIYPAANGRYVIYKLSFDIASRDIPFYYTAEAARIL